VAVAVAVAHLVEVEAEVFVVVGAAEVMRFMVEEAADFAAVACPHFEEAAVAEASGPRRQRSAAEVASVRDRPLSAAASGAVRHSMAAIVTSRQRAITATGTTSARAIMATRQTIITAHATISRAGSAAWSGPTTVRERSAAIAPGITATGTIGGITIASMFIGEGELFGRPYAPHSRHGRA
jgi:hypothetical protein